MFSEILKIKPIIDKATAAIMERTLFTRFDRAAKRFGRGLRSALQGGVVGGAIVALVNKILNPLQSLEERFRNLLGQGTDFKELADRLGTSPGQLKNLQDVALAMGVAPDKFREMVIKFAESVETARREFKNPFEKPSEASVAVREFIGEKDLLEGFRKFLAGLQKVGQGPGVDIGNTAEVQQRLEDLRRRNQTLPKEEREFLIKRGLLRHYTGEEVRADIERQVLGGRLFGAARTFAESDPTPFLRNLPSQQQTTEAINRLEQLASNQRLIQVMTDAQNFILSAERINNRTVNVLEQFRQQAESRAIRDLADITTLKNLQAKAEDLIDLVQRALVSLTKIAEAGDRWLNNTHLGKQLPSGRSGE